MKTESEVASSEEFKEKSKMLSKGNAKSIRTIHNDFNKVIAGKEEEISHLRDHNQKLLLQIKKENDRFQRNQQFEEENQDLQKELSCKDEESTSLKRVNQELLEKIKNLKEREPKNQGNQYNVFNSNYKEEILHLNKFNRNMLIQVSKLK